MHSIPMERFAGARLAFGAYGMPTVHIHLSTRARVVLAMLGVVVVLQLLGVIDLTHPAGVMLGAGTLAPIVPTERSAKLRTQWRENVTQARAILDGSPTPVLSQEDQNRYDALIKKAGELRQAAEQDEALADQERTLAAPLATSPHPVVRGLPVGDQDGPVLDTEDLSAERTVRQSKIYQAAFRRFLRYQDLGRIRNSAEARALQMDLDASGGNLVAPEQFMATLIKAVDNVTHIRQHATVYTVENAASLGVPSLSADPDDFDWTTELATGNEDSAMAFGKREFRPHPLAKRIKISKKLLRASTLDVEGLVINRLAYKLGVTQEKAYLTGNGNQRPLGVFVASNDGVPTSRDVTASSSTDFVGDDLQNTKFSLKPQYRASANTAWMFHRDGIKMAAKLKDGEGRYMLQLGLAVDVQDTLLGFRFMESEYAPSTFTAGQYVGMLADWSWYWIADALDMNVQRLGELYAESNQDGFIARYEGDGMPVQAEAFARLKLG